MDLWTLEPPHIQMGLEQLGKPRGAFRGRSHTLPAAARRVGHTKQQAANAEIQRQETEAALRQRAAEEKAAAERREIEEKARAGIAKKNNELQWKSKEGSDRRREPERREEKRKEEQEAERQKILLATAEGVHYSGSAKQDDGSFIRISLVFGVQDEKGSVVRARILNPGQPQMVAESFAAELRP